MSATLTPNFAWVLLVIAGLLEVVWAVSMKASHGFTKHHFTTITLVAAALSFWLLGLALRQLPVGTAYAVWTGIGAVGAAIFGIALLGESLTIGAHWVHRAHRVRHRRAQASRRRECGLTLRCTSARYGWLRQP